MIPNDPNQHKPRDRKKVILRLGKYLLQHKWMVLAAVSLTITGNLLALLGPMLSGYAIDAIGVGPGQTNFDLVLFYCGLMLVFYVLSSGLSYLLSVLMVKISQKIVYQMRKDLVDKLLELPVRFLTATRPETSSAAFPMILIQSTPRCPTTCFRLQPAPSPSSAPLL